MHDGQSHDGSNVVVRGHAAVSLEPAAEAPVDKRLLAVAAGEDSDGRHARAAFAGAVARYPAIDMQRVEAVRTVIPVPASELD